MDFNKTKIFWILRYYHIFFSFSIKFYAIDKYLGNPKLWCNFYFKKNVSFKFLFVSRRFTERTVLKPEIRAVEYKCSWLKFWINSTYKNNNQRFSNHRINTNKVSGYIGLESPRPCNHSVFFFTFNSILSGACFVHVPFRPRSILFTRRHLGLHTDLFLAKWHISKRRSLLPHPNHPDHESLSHKATWLQSLNYV